MRKLIPGQNDLFTVNPVLAAEWHPTKNGDLTPDTVTAHSNKKVWWRCSKGHEWQEIINNRIHNHNCPYCSGHKVWPGFNDLTTTHPELAAQWHPALNEELSPHNVNSGSQKKVWWICEKGHEWQAVIKSRSSGSGCPYCSGRRAIPGETDIATTHPELAKEWHPTKNVELAPQMVMAGSRKVVWWICENGHEWKTTINYRLRGYGCPYCSNKRVLPGVNDLATTNPELAAQWHPTKNGALTPDTVKAGSDIKVWWLGKCGHEWEAVIHNRSCGSGCPTCSKRLKSGVNDLGHLQPELATEWHPTKNGDLTPQNVTAQSHKKVWWLGSCGHDWQAKISDRSRGSGCPTCARRRQKKQ